MLVVALPEPLGVPVQQVAQLPVQMADANNDREQMVNANPPAGDPRMQQSAEDQQRPGPQSTPQRQSVQSQGQRAPLQPGPQQQLAQQGRTKGSYQNEEFTKSTREYNKRSDNTAYVQQMANVGNNFNRPPIFGKDAAGTVNEGIVKAVWAGDGLVLARRVSANGREYVQGCLLDWPAIKTALLTDITDLLPHAALERVLADAETTPERERQMLAAIPVRLVPGPAPVAAVTGVTPIRISLALAWACLLLAAGAIGMLMLGAVTLSERRGAFVSAVTHELRTPLTTLRMYTEMLAAGMIREDAKKQSYLQTMQAEADRLGHLVENVLAYSRIERGRARGHVVTLAVGELIAGVQRRLSERAEHAGMRLAVETGDGEAVMVRADPSVVEQILFNLVDNACKYAASAEDRSIHLSAGRENGHVAIRVRDHGPGIGAVDQRRLFRPFSKSAREAANTAPGVGLGLALSRRLARELGGDLQLENGEGAGARFVLTLPASAG
jgi:signal transduction histidine kinase